MVVSEMGEQWSPQTLPARIDEIAPRRMCISPGARWSASGTTNGKRMAIVPQEVPVAKLTAAAITKTAAGRSPGASPSPMSWIRYSAVWTSSQMPPSAQARTRMAAARSIDFIPSTHASIASPRESARVTRESTMATKPPAVDAQRSALRESALPKMFRKLSASPSWRTAARPWKYMPRIATRTTVRTGPKPSSARGGAAFSKALESKSEAGRAPGRLTWPVVRARTSARRIGPKSRRLSTRSSPKKSMSQG